MLQTNGHTAGLSLYRLTQQIMANQHTQSAGSSASTLITATIQAFDEGQAASPQEGMSLITDWFSSVKTNHNASDVMEPLRELHDELQTGAPDNARLSKLLIQLADITEKQAPEAEGDMQSQLETMATSLRNFAGQLSTTV